MRILNYTPATFGQRVTPFLDTLAYGVLTDRTHEREERREERLGEWPPAKGPLPHEDLDANLTELWRWINHTLADALLERPGQGTYRLTLYGPKGLETLGRITLRAESDEDEEDPEDPFDIPADPVPERPPPPADRLERAVDLHERSVNMMLHASDRMLRQAAAVNTQTLRALKGQADTTQAQVEQLLAHLKDMRQMVQDVIEVLVAERLTTSEQQAEAIVDSARGKGKSKEPNPLVTEALKETMGGIRDWLLNGRDMPGAAKALLNHPKAKELLTNPKLAERLKTNPELLDQLMDFISATIDDNGAPPAGGNGGNGSGPSNPYDIPDE